MDWWIGELVNWCHEQDSRFYTINWEKLHLPSFISCHFTWHEHKSCIIDLTNIGNDTIFFLDFFWRMSTRYHCCLIGSSDSFTNLEFRKYTNFFHQYFSVWVSSWKKIYNHNKYYSKMRNIGKKKIAYSEFKIRETIWWTHHVRYLNF